MINLQKMSGKLKAIAGKLAEKKGGLKGTAVKSA